MALEPRPNG